MRFKSTRVGGFQVFAVTGVNTVSFGIARDAAAATGLLGFAVERIDPAGGEQYFVPGYKVFPSVIPNPDENTVVSTFDHPVQSFVWDDFTAQAGHTYTYRFHPLKGKPKMLDRTAPPVEITVKTEAIYDASNVHDVFFNRGVASSQAYARRFHNLPPDQQPTPADVQAAKDWLSRDLDDALVRFIRTAKKVGSPGTELEFAL